MNAHQHDWGYDCRGNGPFCKLCGAGPVAATPRHTMTPVRLWRQGDSELWRLLGRQSPLPQDAEFIALPAAEHAALVALLAEVRGALRAKVGGHHFRAGESTGFSEDGMDITYGPDVHIAECPGCRSQDARDSLLDRLDAAFAGLGGAGKSPEART